MKNTSQMNEQLNCNVNVFFKRFLYGVHSTRPNCIVLLEYECRKRTKTAADFMLCIHM